MEFSDDLFAPLEEYFILPCATAVGGQAGRGGTQMKPIVNTVR